VCSNAYEETVNGDPGWKPAFKGVWRLLVPGSARLISTRASALITTRTFAAGSALQWILFGVILALLDHDLHPTSAAAAVAVFGAVDLFLTAAFRPRRLSADDHRKLRAAFVRSFFLGFTFANVSVLFGFVGFFIASRGRLTTYLAGLPFGIAGMMIIAPTRARLERLQRQLRAAGSSLSIVEVLNEPPEPPRQVPRGRRRPLAP
jgi:hypothetical protein